MCANPNLIRFFPHIDCWHSPLAEICLRQDTCFFQPVQFFIYLLYSRERERFTFLKIWVGHGPLSGIVLSFLWICQGLLRPPQGNFVWAPVLIFLWVIGRSNSWQNVLIGQSQRLNFSIQSVPNRLSVVLVHMLWVSL